jgi:hypothetical protein
MSACAVDTGVVRPLRLMADYCSDALWEVAESESVGNIDPSSLDISE